MADKQVGAIPSLYQRADPVQTSEKLSTSQTPTAGRTGINHLITLEDRQQAIKIFVQNTGLTFDHEGVTQLERQLAGPLLARARASFNRELLESTAQPKLAKTWAGFVADAGRSMGGRTLDVNSLVQYVLREAYMENSLDLHFYAQKVKFYNSVKKKIRDELTRAREELAKYAGMPEDTVLDPPFTYTKVNTEFTGSLEAEALEGDSEKVAAYKDARATLETANAKATTGSGVKLWSGTPALKPPAHGDVFLTGDGQRIDVKGSEVRIYSKSSGGKYQLETRIWGDPHVDEKSTGSGDDWHFGDDSTFILPDGTKICLNTEETRSGVFVVKGVDILSGENHAYVGLGPDKKKRSAGVDNQRIAWDADNPDTRGASGGVFARQANGQWAMLGADGEFRDVANESWSGYLSSKDVTTRGDPISVSAAQRLAADDLLQQQAVDAASARDSAADAAREFAALTKEELSTYIKNTEEQLNSVGEDAQLANVDLQNMLQKQQQTLQMMSNISKMLHDTAMAVIRKIGA